MNVPPEYQSRTGLLLVLDTNTVGEETEQMRHLRQLHVDGWLNLSRTDMVDTELQTAPGDKRDTLLLRSSAYVEHLGPMVLDHSRLGQAVLGNEDDWDRLDRVFSTLFPNADRATATPNHTRDAMHVATAIRNGADGFVTNDRRLLNKHDPMKKLFNWFLMLSPAEAAHIADSRVERIHRRAALEAR